MSRANTSLRLAIPFHLLSYGTIYFGSRTPIHGVVHRLLPNPPSKQCRSSVNGCASRVIQITHRPSERGGNNAKNVFTERKARLATSCRHSMMAMLYLLQERRRSAPRNHCLAVGCRAPLRTYRPRNATSRRRRLLRH